MTRGLGAIVFVLVTSAWVVHAQPGPCENGVRDRQETDVDCGGPLGAPCPPGTDPRFCPAVVPCDRCPNGKACKEGRDCASGRCRRSLFCLLVGCGGVCSAPPCEDGVRNGRETDIDCGGPDCPKRCAPGQRCATGSDCESGVCERGTCAQPSCWDGARNGGELGPDCGGPCERACPCHTRGQCYIFVTRATFRADFGGAAAANAICNAAAKAAGRVGDYRAWVCAGGVPPTAPDPKAPPTKYVRTDESLIANDWGDLTDGWIENPIHYDEAGKSVVLEGPFIWWTFFTWTYVRADGTCDDQTYLSPGSGACPAFEWCPMNCDAAGGTGGWTTRAITAQGCLGDIARQDGGWTDGPSRPCDGDARFYCVEQ